MDLNYSSFKENHKRYNSQHVRSIENVRRGRSSKIREDLMLIGMDGELNLHREHRLDINNLEYHHEHIYRTEYGCNGKHLPVATCNL